MKKAKIMLFSITIMAFVAGVLAFKIKTYGQLFCTRQIENGPGTCEGAYIGKVSFDSGCFYYTLTNNSQECSQTECTITTCLTNVE